MSLTSSSSEQLVSGVVGRMRSDVILQTVEMTVVQRLQQVSGRTHHYPPLSQVPTLHQPRKQCRLDMEQGFKQVEDLGCIYKKAKIITYNSLWKWRLEFSRCNQSDFSASSDTTIIFHWVSLSHVLLTNASNPLLQWLLSQINRQCRVCFREWWDGKHFNPLTPKGERHNNHINKKCLFKMGINIVLCLGFMVEPLFLWGGMWSPYQSRPLPAEAWWEEFGHQGNGLVVLYKLVAFSRSTSPPWFLLHLVLLCTLLTCKTLCVDFLIFHIYFVFVLFLHHGDVLNCVA